MHVKDGVPPKDGENTSNEPVEDEAYEIGKKHALKRYDQFSPNTSCVWGSTRST